MFEYLFRTIVFDLPAHRIYAQTHLRRAESVTGCTNSLGSFERAAKLRFKFLQSGISSGWREPHMPVVPSLPGPSSFF